MKLSRVFARVWKDCLAAKPVDFVAFFLVGCDLQQERGGRKFAKVPFVCMFLFCKEICRAAGLYVMVE